jgi:hypothetical protein
MAEQSDMHAPEASPSEDIISMLLQLQDDALGEVLRAVKDPGVLLTLANSSSSMCRAIRSKVPVRLQVLDQQQAGFISNAAERGMPFSGCKELVIRPRSRDGCLAAAHVLRAALQWPGLQQLSLFIALFPQQQQDEATMESGLALLREPVPQLQAFHLALPAQLFSRARLSPQLLQVTSLELKQYNAAAATALDMSNLSAMDSLVELQLRGPPPVVAPAAAVTGPFLLPHNLNTLKIPTFWSHAPDPLACWLTHLPGCPQLQHLELSYWRQHHASAHPFAVLRALSQHNKQLRSFRVRLASMTDTWDAPVAELSQAAGHVSNEWGPDSVLALPARLESLAVHSMLHIRGQEDWQCLARLLACTNMTEVQFHWAPELQQAGASLAVLELRSCRVHLGGRGVGALLLACPHVQYALLDIGEPPSPPPPAAAAAASSDGGSCLTPHPRLKELDLGRCDSWGDAAAASAQFAGLAPVVSGVSQLTIRGWPRRSDAHPTSQSPLPDLSLCSKVTVLVFGAVGNGVIYPYHVPTQEQFVSMVAPLKQLQRITWRGMGRNAIGMSLLKPFLPKLQEVGAY